MPVAVAAATGRDCVYKCCAGFLKPGSGLGSHSLPKGRPFFGERIWRNFGQLAALLPFSSPLSLINLVLLGDSFGHPESFSVAITWGQNACTFQLKLPLQRSSVIEKFRGYINVTQGLAFHSSGKKTGIPPYGVKCVLTAVKDLKCDSLRDLSYLHILWGYTGHIVGWWEREGERNQIEDTSSSSLGYYSLQFSPYSSGACKLFWKLTRN